MNVKVLSWNLWFNCNFEQTKEFLTRVNADILGLQEVVEDEPSRDVIGFLKGLGYEYVYAPAFKVKSDGRTVGDAIFSRHKIASSSVYNFPGDDQTRNAVRADVAVDGKIIHFFSTHLLHAHLQPSEVQDQQARDLLSQVPSEKSVVMGDFNAEPNTVAIKAMREALIDTDPADAPTWSLYETGCHVCKIKDVKIRFDYIFVTRDLKFDSFRIEFSKASDHLPILINLEI